MSTHSSPEAVSLEWQPWALPSEEVARRLGVDPARGLAAAEARRRRREHGSNTLREVPPESASRIFARQFGSLIMLLLLAAAAVAAAFGEVRESAAIGLVLALNAVIGFVVELRAVRSMEALRQLGRVQARARRDGATVELAASELVPGDVVVLEAGDLVPADLRLLAASKLQADESALTGESVPVSKRPEALDDATPLAERACLLFRGTAVTRGSGEGVVVATGMATEVGRIAHMVEQAEAELTPLERRLNRLGARLVWVTIAVAAVVTGSGVAAGKDLLLMVETGIALAVATVPEGLPIVATVALARGMWRMARRNALVNRLSAVETLGATTIICSDKTGTLTENRMTVVRFAVADGDIEVAAEQGGTGSAFSRAGAPVDPPRDALLRALLETAALCNNAALASASGAAASGEPDASEPNASEPDSGEPMEVALLRVGRAGGVDRPSLLREMPEVREEAFVPETKMMATFHRSGDGFRVAVKGAPEAVIAACAQVRSDAGESPLDDEARDRWLRRNHEMAADGLRVLALACKVSLSERDAPYEGLVLLGLVGFMDPPREKVGEAIEACRRAGMRVVMVTGDQAGTAAAIGEALGLPAGASILAGDALADPTTLSEADLERIRAASIFARVSPKQKLDLIEIHQRHGEVVAMTGDGVNDAPALKKADIGIAMGKRGTQVAAQAADMVLRDDAFATIVAAVGQGRVIFDNIRKFVLYLLSCNVSEVMVVAIASLAQMPLPIQPLQILFLNLVTDVFPALALGVGEGGPDVMRRPPRDPREAILARRHWLAIAAYGLAITACVLTALAVGRYRFALDKQAAVTLSFLTLAFAQLWHVFNMTDARIRLWRGDVARNPWVWAALLLCVVLLLAAVYWAPAARALGLVAPTARGWLLVIALSAVPLVAGRLAASLRRRPSKTP